MIRELAPFIEKVRSFTWDKERPESQRILVAWLAEIAAVDFTGVTTFVCAGYPETRVVHLYDVYVIVRSEEHKVALQARLDFWQPIRIVSLAIDELVDNHDYIIGVHLEDHKENHGEFWSTQLPQELISGLVKQWKVATIPNPIIGGL